MCRYCFYETGVTPRQRVRLDRERALQLIREDLCSVFNHIYFTGGEVLLLPFFWDLVQCAREAGLSVSFLTDGIRLNAHAIEKVCQYGVEQVAVSLDSLIPEINERARMPRRGVEQTTRVITANITALAAARCPGLSITILQTVHRQNISSIIPMRDFCAEFDVDLLVHPCGLPEDDNLDDLRVEGICPGDLKSLVAAMEIWANGHAGRVRYVRIAEAYIQGRRPEGVTCPMGTRAFFLDTAGNLSPCFHRRDLHLGIVWDEPTEKILARSGSVALFDAPCASLACACMLE